MVAAGAGILAVVVFDRGVTGVFIGLIVGNALAAAYGAVVVRSTLPDDSRAAELGTMLAYGLPLVPAAFALWALALVDRIMLSKLGSLSDVGQYAVANRVSNVLLLAVTGFVLAFGPYVFSIYARDPELEKQVRGKTLTYLIICLTAAALALTLFAQELISIVAPAFDDAYKAVGLLTFSVVAFGVSTVVMAGISIVRRTKVLALLAVVAAAINIGLNFVLIPPFGMVGAAVATAVAYAVLAALNFQVAQRYYRTPYERRKVLTALGLASVVGILGVVPLGPAPVAILVKTLALGGYLALLRVSHVIEASDLASHPGDPGRAEAHPMGAAVSDDRPLVSVIMAAYNGAEFIGETIESVLAQTYQPIELVVVDDASEDETPEIVASYAERHPGRRTTRTGSERLGPCRRRNDAIDRLQRPVDRLARPGRPLASEKTEREVAVMQARPEVGLVYSGYEAFDSDTGETARVAGPRARGRGRRPRAAVRGRLLRRLADGAVQARRPDPPQAPSARERLLVRRRLLPLAHALTRLAGRPDRRDPRAIPPAREQRERASDAHQLPSSPGCAAPGFRRSLPGGQCTAWSQSTPRPGESLPQGCRLRASGFTGSSRLPDRPGHSPGSGLYARALNGR